MKSGITPDEWEITTLGSVCGRITTGKLDANAMVADGDYPFFTCARENYWIDEYAFDCEALLVSGNGANVGYVHYYSGKFNAYQRTYVINEFSVDVQFLKLFLERNLRERIRVEVNAGNTPYITMGTLTEMEVVLPRSRREQHSIAAALIDVDALLDALDRLVAKKRDLKQATMQRLLTGQTRLPGFQNSWEVKRLGDIAEVFKGAGLSKSSLTPSGRRPCILYGELFTAYGRVIENVVSKTDSPAGKPSQVGDVLVPGSTTTEGIDLATASALLMEGVALGGDINIIRGRRKGAFNATFLAYYLTDVKKDAIAERAQGITIIHLYGRDLLDLSISLPDLPEQAAIAGVLSDIEAELEAVEQRRDKTRALKQGMMQELLTGRTRLV